MNKYTVTGVWTVKAASAEEAENLIEDAVARRVDEADLETCDAEFNDYVSGDYFSNYCQD